MPVHKIRVNDLYDDSTSGTSQINSVALPVHDMAEVVVYVDVTAVTGTGPLLDLVPQISHDNTAWFDVPGKTLRVSATGNYQIRIPENLGKHLRVAMYPSGTTPVFTLKVTGEAKS